MLKKTQKHGNVKEAPTVLRDFKIAYMAWFTRYSDFAGLDGGVAFERVCFQQSYPVEFFIFNF